MTSRKNTLDLIQIPRPCSVGWDEMIGNDQVRYCGACCKNVFNLSKMTRSRAEALVAASHGDMCARFIRLSDGTIKTEEPHSGLGLLDRRASPVAAAVVTAVLGVGPAAAALPRSGASVSAWSYSLARDGSPAQATADGGSGASLTVTVKGDDGTLVAGAKVTLTSLDTGNSIVASAGTGGIFQFSSAPPGSYSIKIEADGFITSSFNGVELVSGRTHQTDVLLKVAPKQSYGFGGSIALPPQPLRKLYEDSSLIAVGRPLKSSTVERGEDSNVVKTSVEISQTLKGSPKKNTIYVYHDEETDGEKDRFADGATLLMFLEHRESNGVFKATAYEPVDATFAIKNLADSDLSAYIDRIKSLQAILQEDRPCHSELAEWLVQTVEDPATRWEGAADLDSNGSDQVFQDCGEEKAPAVERSIDRVLPGEPIFETGLSAPVCPIVRIADMLTPAQRDRVMKVVLGLDKISDADEMLIRAVGEWGDPRLVPFILSKLEQMQDEPAEDSEFFVTVLAEAIDDSNINTAACAFRDAAYKTSRSDDSETGDSSPDDRSESGTTSEKPDLSGLLKQFIFQVKTKIAQQEALQASTGKQ